MLTVQNLKEFVTKLQNQIASINFSEVVMDDSQLVSFLKDRPETDNNMLFAIIPDYGMNGSEDTLKWNNQLMFFVLRKVSSKEKHPVKIDALMNAQASANEIITTILEHNVGDNGDICGITNDLVENSIVLTPVWEKAQTYGWIIEIDLRTRV